MKAIKIHEWQMMSYRVCERYKHPHDTLISFEASDNLDELIFNRYVNMVRDRDEALEPFDVKCLLQSLIRAEENGYDINDLLLVAMLAGKRQVIYEHHLKKQ